VLERGSKKFLRRIGAQQQSGKGGLEGSWQGDWSVMQRMAMDKGEYVRIGQLSPDSPDEELLRPYTVRALSERLSGLSVLRSESGSVWRFRTGAPGR
jgi:hypothetical protein